MVGSDLASWYRRRADHSSHCLPLVVPHFAPSCSLLGEDFWRDPVPELTPANIERAKQQVNAAVQEAPTSQLIGSSFKKHYMGTVVDAPLQSARALASAPLPVSTAAWLPFPDPNVSPHSRGPLPCARTPCAEIEMPCRTPHVVCFARQAAPW